MRRAILVLGLILPMPGCSLLLDTAELQGGDAAKAGGDGSSPDALGNGTSFGGPMDAGIDLNAQCRSEAGAQNACMARNCCPYIMACESDPICSAARTTYDQCLSGAKTDSLKRGACAAGFRNAGDGKANEVMNCENLYRDVCNDV
jgi:hypothetical protein